MRDFLKALVTPVPFYVTRPAADGLIASFSVSAILGLVIVLLVVANALLWGIVGVIAAIGALS